VIVDSHQHFWDPAQASYPFLDDPDAAALRRPFGPDDLAPELHANGVDCTVVVQARSSLDETHSLLALAREAPFVRGVVGWVDLTDPDAERTLAALEGPLVGIRHQVHDEKDPRWLLRPAVQRGLAAVADAGLAFDLLVRTRELPAAIAAARAQPDLVFVLDHLAKPPFRSGNLEPWRRLVAELAELPNVTCKLSGLVTEAAHGTDVGPGLEHALACFGADRCLFGSDWPVCLLAAEYATVLGLVRDAVRAADRPAVLGGSASRVYRLDSCGAERRTA
jgi:L-fucono-1,5-lactonase